MIFPIIAITLAVLSVYNWQREAEPFLIHMRRLNARPGFFGAIRNVFRAISAIPKLFPLALDVLITISLVSALGLSQGVMGANVGLAMSNAIAYFIRREMKQFRGEINRY
jgi:hypothetical protein